MKTVLMVLALFIALPSASAPAFAQARSHVPLARQLFDEGVQAARARHWNDARDRFARSFELAPRALTLFNLAAAQVNTGRLVEASESYRQFLRNTADGRYPEYRQEATRALTDLEGRIAFARISITGLGDSDQIVLDDRPLPRAGLGEAMPLDPGKHEIQVQRGERVVATRRIDLEVGGSQSVDIQLEPELAALRTDLGPAPASPTGPSKSDSGGILRSPWFWGTVAVALGGAGSYLALRDRTGDPTTGTLGRGIIEF